MCEGSTLFVLAVGPLWVRHGFLVALLPKSYHSDTGMLPLYIWPEVQQVYLEWQACSPGLEHDGGCIHLHLALNATGRLYLAPLPILGSITAARVVRCLVLSHGA